MYMYIHNTPNRQSTHKYRSITINNLLGKTLDHIIIEKPSEALKTCNYQFAFVPWVDVLPSYYIICTQINLVM